MYNPFSAKNYIFKEHHRVDFSVIFCLLTQLVEIGRELIKRWYSRIIMDASPCELRFVCGMRIQIPAGVVRHRQARAQQK